VKNHAGRQLDGVQVDKTFIDKASGKDVKRPKLQAALDYLREGDVLVVHSIDRLARNLDDLRKIVLGLTGRGGVVEFVKEHLTLHLAMTTQLLTLCVGVEQVSTN